MNDSNIYQSLAARLTRLKPYAAIAGGMFLCIAVLVMIAGIYDLKRSIEELPARVIYSTIMTFALAMSFGIAGYLSIKSYATLKAFGVNPTQEHFDRTVNALVAFFNAFFFWLIFTLIVIVIMIFMPVY